jgi:hypothetical protein
LAGLIPFAVSKEAIAAPPSAPTLPSAKPRYLVQITLGGGFDSVYTTDPKTTAEVEPWVDVPFNANEILHADGIALGPHLAPLRPFASKLTIVNGVSCATVGHGTAQIRISRMKFDAEETMPTLLDVVGAQSTEHPLANVHLGIPFLVVHSPGWFPEIDAFKIGSGGGTHPSPAIFEFLDTLDPDDMAKLSASLRRQATKLRASRKSALVEQTSRNYERIAELLVRLPKCSKFVPQVWSPNPARQQMAMHMQRTLWLLENDLSRCAYVGLGMLEWDSHHDNAVRQTEWNLNFAEMASKFFAELETRRNAHGTLAENTNIVIASELGRYPRLNSDKGKDHFPEMPMIFMGPSFGANRKQGRSFGRTNRQMAATPISPESGLPSASGIRPTLDDVGVTILTAYGIDAGEHGYAGHDLAFLRQS